MLDNFRNFTTSNPKMYHYCYIQDDSKASAHLQEHEYISRRELVLQHGTAGWRNTVVKVIQSHDIHMKRAPTMVCVHKGFWITFHFRHLLFLQMHSYFWTFCRWMKKKIRTRKAFSIRKKLMWLYKRINECDWKKWKVISQRVPTVKSVVLSWSVIKQYRRHWRQRRQKKDTKVVS